jgi:hypothetical protein
LLCLKAQINIHIINPIMVRAAFRFKELYRLTRTYVMLFIDTASAARSKVTMNNGCIKIWKVTLGLILRPYVDSILDKLRKTKHLIKNH